jgi:hypothetical protein
VNPCRAATVRPGGRPHRGLDPSSDTFQHARRPRMASARSTARVPLRHGFSCIDHVHYVLSALSRKARRVLALLVCVSVPLATARQSASAQHGTHSSASGATGGGTRISQATARDTVHSAPGSGYDIARARRWNQEWTSWSHTLVWGVAVIFAMACLGVAWLSIHERRERRLRTLRKEEQRREKLARRNRTAAQRQTCDR